MTGATGPAGPSVPPGPGPTGPLNVTYTMSGSLSIPVPDVGVASRSALCACRDRVREIKTEPSWPMDLAFALLGVAATALIALIGWGPVRDSLDLAKQNHYAFVYPLLWCLVGFPAGAAVLCFVFHVQFKNRRADTTERIAGELEHVIQGMTDA